MRLINQTFFLQQEFKRLVPTEIRDHSLRVAEKAEAAAGDLSREFLYLAGMFHDIGKSRDLRKLNFHPLDGANYLLQLGEIDLAALVSSHVFADREAKELGISFYPWQEYLWGKRSEIFLPYARVLDIADLTTSPDGKDVDAGDRLSDIEFRYGKDSLQARITRERMLDLDLLA